MGRLWWHGDGEALLREELRTLDQAGVPATPDEDFITAHQAYKLDLQVPGAHGEPRRMWAVYPDLYPWFRPEVFSPEEDLAFHQGPFHKNLCLLDRPAAAWDPGGDTLAFLVTEQLPKVYRAQDPDGAAEMEVPQAEPYTAWYDYWPAGGFIVDGSWDLSGSDGGTFEYVLLRHRLNVEPREREQLVGLVLHVRNQAGQDIATADNVLLRRFAAHRRRGRWGRLGEPLHETAAEARGQLGRLHEHVSPVRTERLGQGPSPGLEVVAAVFPVEGSYRGSKADAWTFLVTTDPPLNRQDRRRLGRDAPPGRRIFHVAGLNAGRDDLGARMPELWPLTNMTVAVFGLGGVGGPSVVEFAKAGIGHLRLVDHDRVEPATSIRHPLGYIDAGRLKAVGLEEHLATHHPLVDATVHPMRLGAVRSDGQGKPQQEVLDELLEQTDLVYDATGDHGVALFLCDLAFRLGVPYINVSTTTGAWGGRIAVFRPNGGPCFACFLAHLRDEETREVHVENRLSPPADPSGEIQPFGCADATFTGAGFDIAQIAMAGVRLAVSTLTETKERAYPSSDWNVATIRLRDEDGCALAGETYHHGLEIHPDCGECERRSKTEPRGGSKRPCPSRPSRSCAGEPRPG